MDIEVTLAFNQFKIGFEWFEKEEFLDYNEFNIYLPFFKFSFIWF